MAEACCPAACGELIQGWLLQGEKLVSCPVNWFSTVSVTDGASLPATRPRMRQALAAVLALAGADPRLAQALRIECDSTIPLAKGMASSTADIAACALAGAHHLGFPLSEDQLAQLCVTIEPSDSTPFPALTLFDHQTGSHRQTLGNPPPVALLLLESPLRLRTADYHRRDRQAALLTHADTLAQALALLRRGITQQSPSLIGEASTLSARASQSLLVKPAFNRLLALVERYDLFGLNVAHSGSVLGLLYDARRHDIERIEAALSHPALACHYPRTHRLQLIGGGLRSPQHAR